MIVRLVKLQWSKIFLFFLLFFFNEQVKTFKKNSLRENSHSFYFSLCTLKFTKYILYYLFNNLYIGKIIWHSYPICLHCFRRFGKMSKKKLFEIKIRINEKCISRSFGTLRERRRFFFSKWFEILLLSNYCTLEKNELNHARILLTF